MENAASTKHTNAEVMSAFSVILDEEGMNEAVMDNAQLVTVGMAIGIFSGAARKAMNDASTDAPSAIIQAIDVRPNNRARRSRSAAIPRARTALPIENPMIKRHVDTRFRLAIAP